MSNPSITADKTPWYQWDTGLTVTVSGGAMDECHFANRKQGTAYVQAVINGVARVPDELLQVAAQIKVYGFAYDDAGGQTYVDQSFDVIARNIPSDYTYTKTIQKTIRDAEAARDEAVQAAKDAKASELAANDSSVEASNSAQSAGDSASEAATSASNAAKSAGEAAKSASDAKAAASKAVEDASELLKTYTDNAATSASNAADAASAASGSASNAATSASESATSAQEAKTAAGNAASEVLSATKANADAAAQSATDAANSKAGAEAAKGEAAASASNAAESATAAAKSASDAAASVGAINVIEPLHTATRATADNTALAIGNGSRSHGSYSIAIGASSDCGNDSSVAMGYSARTTRDAEFSIGSISGGRYLANVKSPELDTDAPNKKYTDDNDSNTLTEAKKYTDANTSNALVGTVSGKLLHVEDAWPGKPLGLTIDGASKQDGTPSPESPAPITVVENPVLNVTGMNLLRYTNYYGTYYAAVGNRLDTINELVPLMVDEDGLYSSAEKAGEWKEGHLFATEPLPAGRYYMSFALWSDTGAGAFSVYRTTEDYTVTARISGYQASSTQKFTVDKPIKYAGKPIDVEHGERICIHVNINGLVPNELSTLYFETPTVCFEQQVTWGAYSGQSLPITLPEEHPYLAALPNGTHDEIVIDKDGNASLVARVQKVSLNKWYQSSSDYYAHFLPNDWVTASAVTNIGIAVTQSRDHVGKIWFGTAKHIVAYTPRDVDTLDSISAIGILGYFSQEPVTYRLGKLDIPYLPENISNVWTDAELTTNMNMTYKRDINIAFDNLVQSVVAAAAGE